MSIATSPVQIGRRPSPITLTDIATGKIADLLADEAGSDSLAVASCREARRVLGLQLRHVLRHRDRQ